MPRPMKRRSKKAGLPPGTLVHIGEQKMTEPKIILIDYDETHFEEKEFQTIEECYALKEKLTVTWINVDGLHRVGILERLGDCFGLHPLVLEDILNTDQRPKMEDYEGYLYVVLKMLYQNDHGNRIEAEQVSLVLGPHFVLSFQERQGDVFTPVRERLRSGKGRLRKLGADYLAYALLDAIVDHYFVVLEKLGERIEALEEELVVNPAVKTLHEIDHLKREMLFLRKAAWPLREVISGLQRGESSLITPNTRIYLRDVYDHAIQAIDTIETYRDMLSGMLDIYLSSVSNRLNAVMKVLTVIATIFMPLTFLAGVYGMNFKYMPELGWRWGYPLFWLVILILGVLMLVYFRKKKWL